MNYKLTKEVKLPEQIFDARYHPKNENNLICAVTIGGNVHLIENGELKTNIKKHHKGSSIRKIRFDKDGRMVTIAKTVKIHDLDSNTTAHTLKRGEEKFTTSLYSVKPLTNNIICAGDDDGGVFVWDTRTNDQPIFSSRDSEQYISDIDGKYDPKRLIVCTSGEGTLTAYDLRANKMIEPQSELFEAGFQCVKMVDKNKKVVIGGEDGAIYVFNQNEWAHTSGKFAISDDTRNRGKCSIDCIEMIPDSSIFLVGCSDGRLRSLTLWPHQILDETAFCKKSSLESVHINPHEGKSELVISGGDFVNIINFEENDNECGDEIQNCDSSTSLTDSSGTDQKDIEDKECGDDAVGVTKKLKLTSEDYLNVFK